MSIATKMTAIADKIRAILGISSKMGLDAMSTNLGTVQTNIASAYTSVGNKGGTVPSSKTIGNLASAVDSIQLGVTVKRKAGTYTTNSSGKATVNCGWQPDVVYVKGVQDTDSDGTVSNSAAIVFSEENRTGPLTVMWTTGGLHEFLWSKTSTGFSVEVMVMDYDFNDTLLKNATFNYVAIKYT